ncbi:MAG TPA: hypothetical protein VMF08_01175 [Candidatus Sulfotelmatobacter sp.]|nr:hypothetical protein [Candidatus Sulfotelmatobacter sp.]
MQAYPRNSLRIALFLALLLAGVVPLQAQYEQYNDWINPNAGKWEVGSNWSQDRPPSTNDGYNDIFTGTNITIDATTSGSFPDSMTVNYVFIDAPQGLILELNNAGTNVPLHLLQNLEIGGENNSEVVVTNSAVQVDETLIVGDEHKEAATFELDSGWAQAGTILDGNGGYGTLNLNGGTLTDQGSMTLGGPLSFGGNGGGDFEMFGGALIVTNDPIYLGGEGFGWFYMAGGCVQAQAFQIGNAAGSQGQLFVEGGTILVSSNILVGNNLVTSPCSIAVSSDDYYGTIGTLIVTNAAGTAYIDVAQNGSLTLNGGVLIVDNLILTNGGTFTNLSGTFELVPPLNIDNGGSVVLAGSTNDFDSGVQLGSTAGGTGSLTLESNSVMNVDSNLVIVSSSLTSTSSVTLNGGSLILSNGPVQVGPVGSGQLIVTGGNHVIQQLWLGSSNDLGSGFFHMSGGYVKILGTGTGPGQGLISNWVVVDGGDLDGSGTSFTIGEGHDSQAYLTGDAVGQYADLYVGYSPGYTGTYDQTNGIMYISDSLIVGTGDCVNGAVGEINLYGGTLYVTNATHTAVLDVLNGTVVVNAGATLVVDNLILTNACGHFMKEGGRVCLYNPPVLDPNLDADNNGESNAYKEAAGLDPLDPNSVFIMTGAVVTNNTDISVSWTTEGGHSYVVQTNGDLGGGSFSDILNNVIVVNGSGPGTTNYVISGAATNPGCFYRVRLGP